MSSKRDPIVDDKLKKARIKMFRQETGLHFFGICCFKFKWIAHSMSEHAEGYIMFDGNNLYETADAAIHLNYEYVSKGDYTYDNVVALVVHELLHILKRHGVRRKKRETQLWALATDHVVDRDLKEMKLKPYEDRFNIIDDLHNQLPNCTTEEAYEWLNKNIQRFSIKMNGAGDGNGNNPGDGNSPSTATITDERTGEEYTVNVDPGGVKQKDIENSDTKNQASLADSFVSQARAIFENLKQRGTVGGSMSTYLTKLLAVKIPWDELLEKAIKTNVIQTVDERSWRQLHKNYLPHGITLPGYSYGEETDGTGTLIIMVDSSGSVSDNELKKFADVIRQSMNYFKKIILLVHDMEIKQIKEFGANDTTAFMSFIQTQGFKGRGGTSHKYVFDYVEREIWSDVEERDALSMVISMTDAESDVEQLYASYDWIINNTPLIFVITGKSKIDSLDFAMESIYINGKDD